jgi:hypothetical protein
MKKTFLVLPLLIVMSMSQSFSQNVVIFDEMLRFLNQGVGRSEVNAFDVIMTNNTIRTNGEGKVYQYASFGQGTISSGCFEQNQMTYTLSTKFSDRNTFNGANDSETCIIFKENNQVRLRVTNHTWGGTGVTSSGIELFRTGLGGYCMRIRGSDGFSTLTFTRTKNSCIP